MIEKLQKLSMWLKNNNLFSYSQKVMEIKDWDEPWHEEAVKEFGDEPISEDEYLEKEISQKIDRKDYKRLKYIHYDFEIDITEKILEENKIHLVSVGEKPALINGGYNGKVFRVIYRGKAAVAKVTLADDGYEVTKWRYLLNNSKTLSPEVKKHIPEIHGLITDSITFMNRYDREQTIRYFIIIMEELYPLPPDIKGLMAEFPEWGSGEEYTKEFLDIPESAGLTKALLSLKHDLGLTWGDLHEENVLMGRDGNLKIIDMGCYQL